MESSASAHPIRLLVTDDLHRSRLTVFFRLPLSIPHFFWLGLWSIVAFVGSGVPSTPMNGASAEVAP